MNSSKEQYLFDLFPKLFPNGRNVDERTSLMCYGFDCSDGWFPLIVDTSALIQQQADKDGIQPIVVQVKEKFGGLRYYVEQGNKAIYDIVHDAEQRSFSICEECGTVGKARPNLGWIKTLCDSDYDLKLKYRGR